MLEWLKTLAPHDGGAHDGGAPSAVGWRVNSHIHLPPNFSAFATVDHALDQACEEKIGVLGASNYYDFSVYETFDRQARERGIFPLFGVEIVAMDDALKRSGKRVNDPDNPGKIYVCGKGIVRFAPMSEAAERLMQLIRRNDTVRMKAMTEKLRTAMSALGVERMPTHDAIVAAVARRGGARPEQVVLQERHLAQAAQVALFDAIPLETRAARPARIFKAPCDAPNDPAAVQNAVRAGWLKAGRPCFEEEHFVSTEQARALVHALGGIFCYPVLADGAGRRCECETPTDALIDMLKGKGVSMVEFIPHRNTVETLTETARTLRAAGFVIAAGTEHNVAMSASLEPVCRDGHPVPPDIQSLFREGACVIAAHQFLTARGERGLTDDGDGPASDRAGRERSIRTLRETGVRVLDAFWRQAKGENQT